ncbi:MAG: carbonic anhydrase [Oscillospiraceae bacterium]|nr:carbonic anhydrase [Oscillospiraceae bacterium]
MQNTGISANDALKKLKSGNEAYIKANCNNADISEGIREKVCKEGQSPYAVIVSCADSRVIPENIFMTGIGELFVIRVAGNVIDNHQLGSIEYATSHLGSNLVVVLGHTHCGAVGAAISHHSEGYIKSITDEIGIAIGDEKDDYKACCLNVNRSVSVIEEKLGIKRDGDGGLKAVGAIYHLEDGKVEFL